MGLSEARERSPGRSPGEKLTDEKGADIGGFLHLQIEFLQGDGVPDLPSLQHLHDDGFVVPRAAENVRVTAVGRVERCARGYTMSTVCLKRC